MEREILIANTKTQKRSKLTTSATTLGELKAAMREADIDYSGMTFTEGISKTQLLDDSTQLPSNVMYKGQPTNNLVILLTNTKKNIASGAISRKEAYELIKESDLQEDVKAKFGKNFTQVTTDNLIKFLKENDVRIENEIEKAIEDSKAHEETVEHFSEPEEVDVEDDEEEDKDTSYTIVDLLANLHVVTLEDAIFAQIAMLANQYILRASDINALKRNLDYLLEVMNNEVKQKSEPVSTSDGSINDDDIDSMIDDIM